MNSDYLAQRSQILLQMAGLNVMEEGSLKSEFRPSPGGGQAGPYYKHQVWKEGRNVSRRVPAQEAPALEKAIANRQKFEQLAQQFAQVTVEHTRQTLGSEAQKKSTPFSGWPKRRKSKD
jgi:hypothetical protein